MAATDKLHKALEALKFLLSPGISSDDIASKNKEKIGLCVLVTDMMCSADTKNAPTFSYLLSHSMETLLKLCDDQDSNIRMIADECLNRIIRAQMHTNASKVNLELHKEIKRNGKARSLRAALWKFAELAHLIRPAKGRPYMTSLVPCIIEISGRSEETVLETLASALPKILSSLGPFMNDTDTKKLINVFMKNIHSENAVLRRTAASSILAICIHSPKPQVSVIHTITSLLDLVLPVKEEVSSYTILGVLNCLRGLIPHVANEGKESFLRGSFGVKRKTNKQVTPSIDSVIQIYELCLHWTHNSDHNVTTAALETLNELLTTPPKDLIPLLIDSHGLGRSRIHTAPLKKLTSKALSDVSVATISAVDDSQLLDSDDVLPSSKVSSWLDGTVLEPHLSPSQLPLQKPLLSHSTLDSLSDYPDSESLASEDIGLMLKDETRQPSPEPEVFLSRDSPSPPPNTNLIMDWDIGNATDNDVCPLLYCARRLVTAFLIPECSSVRVSARALALSCLCQVLKLSPQVFTEKLDLRSQKTPQGIAHVYDVVRLCSHSDPQLRGLSRMVIGHFINSMYHHGYSSFSRWFSKELMLHNIKLDLTYLTALLLEGLEDESSITVRHSLTGFGICVSCIIESTYFSCSILENLLKLIDNPYWLIKAKLIELICSLPYQCIFHVVGSSSFQDKVLNHVIPTLLSNEDNRVRKTTAESIVKLVNYLYFPDDYAEDDIVVARGSSLGSSVFSNIYQLRRDHLDPSEEKIRENKLSRLISILIQTLMFSTSKHLSHGCIEALSQLSVEFHPSQHLNGWLGSCESDNPLTSTGLFSTVVALLTHSPVSLDLECHKWLLTLSGNLFHGLASQFDCTEVFDTKLLKVSEELLTHVMRILNMFVHVTEETVYQSRLPGLSPLRRKTLKPPYFPRPMDEESKEDKKKVIGAFSGIRHCLKILDIIRAGYTNYKLTLDPSSSEKLVGLISHALGCMRQLLLHLKIVETGQVAEELLGYLSYTFVLDSTKTISVVNQLMKSLFELKNHPIPKPSSVDVEKGDPCYGLYAKVVQKPLQELSDHLESSHKPYDPRSHEPASETSGSSSIRYDRADLAKKIRLFEGIVIQSLKEYTMTNNVKLQVEVLELLTQLVNLKVNYCLLDSDQIFIKFVKEQFVYLEAGQIHDAELLIPQIFKFLVHLSNEKNHSKPVMSIPEIIQLCDGLMASGQNPVTHCIPALLPVVEHVFLLNVSNIDINELETQREVILAMLVRLAEFPQVLDILNKVMKEGWRWEEHWKRWYRQTVDTILPLLSEGKLLVNDINALHSLLSLNSNFVAPLNYVLVLLFSHQQDGQNIVQWVGMVTTMLLSVCMYKEERVLLQLEEMNLYVREEGDDPLSVNTISKTLPPQHLLAKLIVRVIVTVVTKLKEYVVKYCEPGQIESLEKTFSNFLLCCIYLFQQGNYELLSKSLATLLNDSSDMKMINDCFLVIAYKCPILTILWADILMLLDKGDPAIWKPMMGECGEPGHQSLNLEVVKQGSVILYCEYLAKKQQDIKALSWLLDGYIEEVVWNCPELPVEKLLCSIYNLERNSKLLLDAASKCVDHTEPIFTHRLLQTLENIHSNYTGSVLNLVALSLVKHKNIAIARLAAAFCCRTIEYMLTLEKTSVLGLLKKDELDHLIKSLKSNRKQCKRYSGLVSILKKLGEEVYNITKWESDDNRTVDVASIKNLKPDKSWLVEQIRLRCSVDSDPDGVRCTRLLSTLDEEELDAMFLSDNFDKSILQHCFSVVSQLEVGKSMSSTAIINTLPPVYKSAQKVLMQYIHEICDALPSTYNAIASGDVKSYENHLQTLISRLNLKHQLLPLALAINNYLVSVNGLEQANVGLDRFIPSQSHIDMVRFGLLCMRACLPLIGTRESQTWTSSRNDLQNLVESSCRILSFDLLAVHLKLEEIRLVLTTVLELITHFTGEDIRLKEFKTEKPNPNDLFLQVGICIASLISWIDDFPNVSSNLPGRMEYSLKALIVSLGRLQKLNLLSRLPVEAWQPPLDAAIPPPIPIHILHEPDILSQIVSRVRLLGWTNRLQFEEMWVCLQSALTPNPDVDNTDQEEISAIMHANSLAIDGITWLILSTLSVHTGNSYPPKLLHVPRCGNHKMHLLQYWHRLEEMYDILFWKLQPVSGKRHLSISIADKRPNLERIDNNDHYGFGQLSIPYLQAQITPSDDSPTSDAQNLVEDVKPPARGIDVRSCLQFVLDLYGQWVLPNSGISLNLQLSMVKSVVCLSDMFSERGHCEWMFHTFVALAKSHPTHDEIMHQYLVIGISKSAAVLQFVEGENSDRVIKIIESALKNSSSLIRTAGIHGVLYLLQAAKTIKKTENSSDLIKLSPQEFRQRLLNACCGYVDENFTEEISNSVDCQLLIALSLFLLEVFPAEVSSPQNLIKTLLHLARNPKNKCIYQTVINGLERLVLTGCDEAFKDQITRLAMERFTQPDPSLSLPALQLLIACIYSGKVKKENPEEESALLPSDTEIMEKTSALFDKIKKGYPIEVEVVCDILPRILSDFFPVLDVSTKVIGEFLSPNQPHKKNMAAMVFQVFTQACNEKQLFLLQDWVVHSLNSFTQNLPLVTAVWSLCCFFISASANPWLRAIFPYVQSRIRQCEYEDKEIFSIAAVQFFSQLDESQRSIFFKSFKGTAASQMSPFSDVIACLS